jgi:hypothetical protein
MPLFCIFDHPQMPLVRISVEKRRRDHDKFGFRLRYVLEISDDQEGHAEHVISLVDDAMGKATKAHGTYQAKYEDVRAAYGELLDAARPPETVPWHDVLRPVALALAATLMVGMIVLIPPATVLFLFVSAIKRQSGLAAMAESAIIWSILDWRPTIYRLIRFGLGGSK